MLDWRERERAGKVFTFSALSQQNAKKALIIATTQLKETTIIALLEPSRTCCPKTFLLLPYKKKQSSLKLCPNAVYSKSTLQFKSFKKKIYTLIGDFKYVLKTLH